MRGRLGLTLAGLVAGVLLQPGASASAVPLDLEVVSGRADLVTGSTALVEVSGPSTRGLRVRLGSRDVTSAFARRQNGRVQGLVTGLPLGPSTLTATRGGSVALVLSNHPLGGPLIAGPQVGPWVCGAVLAPVRDKQCNAPTKVAWWYRSSISGLLRPYDVSAPPADVDTTTTDRGVTVPYVVRVETGAMDRGLYEVAVLATPGEKYAPWAPPRGWNGKLVWPFGGGTAPGHVQGVPVSTLDDGALARGFMVANNSLTVHGTNANDNVSAETVIMLKEYIAKTFGPIRYAIGEGCSGGGLQQYFVGANYPGLFQGLLPNCSFPDIWTTAMEVVDCVLLSQYYNNTSPHLWAVAQQRALVEGHQDPASCNAWEQTFGPRFTANRAANCALPAGQVYDATTRPRGVRCTLNDYQLAIWGRRGKAQWGPVEKRIHQGFARRPLSNVGVQYGLNALQSGAILPEQFVDLNEKVGGLDIDGNRQPQRTVPDPGALATAYRTGQVVDAHGLAGTAILDLRGQDNEEIHTSTYSYQVRERLRAANGTAGNHVIWTGPGPLIGELSWGGCGTAQNNNLGRDADLYVPATCGPESPLAVMDSWLAAVERDRRAVPLSQKVLADKPAAAVDACWVAEHKVTDPAVCRTAYPYFSTTRQAAGGPAANDVIGCALKPLRPADYSVTFSSAQWERLRAAFPTGVCDWRRPGIGQQPAKGTWLSYARGPGGASLGPAPRARRTS